MNTSLDPDLFLEAQNEIYSNVLTELQSGEKRTHWMWFIFPQLLGLGSSPFSRIYGLHDRSQAEEYARHPILGKRLVECCEAVLKHPDKHVSQIMGPIDGLKLCSSMTLFAEVDDHPVFQKILDTFHNGSMCPRTLKKLGE